MQALLGVSGISHGAGSIVGTARYVHHDLAVAPLLIPTSPAVLATGSLQHDLALDALGAAQHSDGPSWEEVRQLVVDTLEVAISPEAGGRVQLPEQGRFKRCVVAAAGRNDGIVLPAWSVAAVRRVRETMDPEAELHWVPGGHASGFLASRWLFVDLILRALRRLEREMEQCDTHGRRLSRL